MWFWLISSISGSILGGAANSWFLDTKIGVWFYEKVDDISTWSAKKLNIKILSEEEAWRKKYPNIAKKLDDLDKRIKEFENND
jgi:hypothetical protein|tara:strand:+ start:702 stop:950 length:249 start_codon:yes stop_codon:yes gene_type:complete